MSAATSETDRVRCIANSYAQEMSARYLGTVGPFLVFIRTEPTQGVYYEIADLYLAVGDSNPVATLTAGEARGLAALLKEFG